LQVCDKKPLKYERMRIMDGRSYSSRPGKGYKGKDDLPNIDRSTLSVEYGKDGERTPRADKDHTPKGDGTPRPNSPITDFIKHNTYRSRKKTEKSACRAHLYCRACHFSLSQTGLPSGFMAYSERWDNSLIAGEMGDVTHKTAKKINDILDPIGEHIEASSKADSFWHEYTEHLSNLTLDLEDNDIDSFNSNRREILTLCEMQERKNIQNTDPEDKERIRKVIQWTKETLETITPRMQEQELIIERT
jgi:hypothetical protein